MTVGTWSIEVSLDTVPTGVQHVDLDCARKLLDKALADWRRAEAEQKGSMAGPLYLPEIRWEMVRLARRMLGD